MIVPRTFCITIRDSPRWDVARVHLDSVGIKAEKFLAFHGEGSGLDRVEVSPNDPDWKTGGKSLGSYLSHYMLWSALLVSSEESAFILEDDAEFDPDWQPRLESAMQVLPADWDLVFAGHCCAEGRPVKPVGNNLWEIQWPLCLHAYFVRRKALPVLLEQTQHIKHALDVQLFYGPLKDLRVYTILPRLAGQRNTVLPP